MYYHYNWRSSLFLTTLSAFSDSILTISSLTVFLAPCLKSNNNFWKFDRKPNITYSNDFLLSSLSSDLVIFTSSSPFSEELLSDSSFSSLKSSSNRSVKISSTMKSLDVLLSAIVVVLFLKNQIMCIVEIEVVKHIGIIYNKQKKYCKLFEFLKKE